MAITLTESAASEAKKYIESAGPESFLRIRLVAGGCSGHNSSLQIDKTSRMRRNDSGPALSMYFLASLAADSVNVSDMLLTLVSNWL